MKRIFVLALILMHGMGCALYAASTITAEVHQSKIVTAVHPDADGDLTRMCIHSAPQGQDITPASPKYCVDVSVEKKLDQLLTETDIVTALNFVEGGNYEVCVSSWDWNANNSVCSTPLVTYHFDTVPPVAPTGVQIQ